ncbi:hypothetical protein NE584_00540 [Clostridium sp. DFI.5.61]|nr:hypothetical protein [Clostridium sp. DFI.5.61]
MKKTAKQKSRLTQKRNLIIKRENNIQPTQCIQKSDLQFEYFFDFLVPLNIACKKGKSVIPRRIKATMEKRKETKKRNRDN